MTRLDALSAALTPRSVAIIGASDNRNKVGGRPVDYLKRFGFQGTIYPVNPARETVQGVKAYPSVAAIPEAPDLAVIALAGEGVAAAVRECAAKGVRTVIILSSGFGETGDEGKQEQAGIAAEAARAGMRIVGPNSQGLANFGNGAVANFSTMFLQVPARDGPVAIVSQSGATSAALYTLLRERDVGVRYVHATGNSADVTPSELALVVAGDPAIRLIILYSESITDPDVLARAAAVARARGVPIVALKAGRSASGAAAAQSHTGALVNSDGVVDAFFRRHGIWRVDDFEGIAHTAELYLKRGLRPGRNLVVVSNSGSSCVMCADAADALGLPLAALAETTREGMRKALASYATVTNPIDLTSSLLGNPEIYGNTMRALGEDPAADMYLISLPVAGEGYDLERIAEDTAAFEKQVGKPVVVCATQASTLEPFRRRGIVAYTSEREALRALDQVTRHAALLELAHAAGNASASIAIPSGRAPFLDEAQSLEVLEAAGVPVVAHRLCNNAEEALAALRELGAPVVVKACSEGLPHKSEYGLVFLNRTTADEVRDAFEACRKGMETLKVKSAGVIVAKMEKGRREVAIGGKVDPVFGPVIMVSDGGKYIEAMPDFCLLMPPFSASEVREALKGLRIAPLFGGVRGEPPMDLDALSEAVVGVAAAMTGSKGAIASIDLNPVMVRSRGEGVVVVDALIERNPDPRPGGIETRKLGEEVPQ